jgi:hyperosmotically inducible protein
MKQRLANALLIALASVLLAANTAAAQAPPRTIGERVDDALITAAVKTKLTTDTARSLVDVNVDTRDGVVHLQGTVPTEEDRREAERLAQLTDGVRAVTNDLKVATGGAASPGR